MATRRSVNSGSGNAGMPSVASTPAVSHGPAQGPSPQDLDLRNRLKSGLRRPGGPPLVGDVSTAAAMDALRNEILASPTDPRNRRGRT